jgi:transposase-like protein
MTEYSYEDEPTCPHCGEKQGLWSDDYYPDGTVTEYGCHTCEKLFDVEISYSVHFSCTKKEQADD